MDVRIESGPVEVIVSGTVIGFSHEPIKKFLSVLLPTV